MAQVRFDMNQAFALLDVHKHWSVGVVNRNGARYAYTCTIWGNGRRVTAHSVQSPARAVERALEKLKNKSGAKLKVVG